MHTVTRLPALPGPTTAPRVRLSSDGAAEPVLTLLHEHGWTLVDTPEANVHCTSPDARLYVGWLPEDGAAWQRGALWTVHVTPRRRRALGPGLRPRRPQPGRRRIPPRPPHPHPPLTSPAPSTGGTRP
jgi:hypothetical protein